MQNIRESSKEGINDMELAYLLDRQRAELDHQAEVQRKLLDVNTLFHGVCVCMYVCTIRVYYLFIFAHTRTYAWFITIVLVGFNRSLRVLWQT